MKPGPATPRDIDEYIAGFPPDVQEILRAVRATIHQAAPSAEETISYKMPAFNLHGHYLIYFAAYKKHIALYPIPAGDPAFSRKIAAYRTGKGTLRFPLDKPIPYRLIARLVRLRAKENLARASTRGKW